MPAREFGAQWAQVKQRSLAVESKLESLSNWARGSGVRSRECSPEADANGKSCMLVALAR